MKIRVKEGPCRACHGGQATAQCSVCHGDGLAEKWIELEELAGRLQAAYSEPAGNNTWKEMKLPVEVKKDGA